LHKLPIQTLKIDRAFIKEMLMNNERNSIINTIVAMAKGLNLNVIAEGVETQQQLDFLREIDCDTAQGFLFGKPLTSDVMMQLLIQEPYALPGAAGGVQGNQHKPH
jgi:EAL domain-containing protein (putative c-di-GMP-specific phosphodiesterase class I)